MNHHLLLMIYGLVTVNIVRMAKLASELCKSNPNFVLPPCLKSMYFTRFDNVQGLIPDEDERVEFIERHFPALPDASLIIRRSLDMRCKTDN